MEEEMHRQFGREWIRGEWFRLAGSVSEFIAGERERCPDCVRHLS